jgi:hypothetical protein
MGVLAARALPIAARVVLIIGLWACALPIVQRDLWLRAPGALRRIDVSVEGEWSVAQAAHGPAVAAAPSPQCAVLGAVIWLKFETATGRHRACTVNRALAARLRLAGRMAKARPLGRASSC